MQTFDDAIPPFEACVFSKRVVHSDGTHFYLVNIVPCDGVEALLRARQKAGGRHGPSSRRS